MHQGESVCLWIGREPQLCRCVVLYIVGLGRPRTLPPPCAFFAESRYGLCSTPPPKVHVSPMASIDPKEPLRFSGSTSAEQRNPLFAAGSWIHSWVLTPTEI